jgi:hypothetical protein
MLQSTRTGLAPKEFLSWAMSLTCHHPMVVNLEFTRVGPRNTVCAVSKVDESMTANALFHSFPLPSFFLNTGDLIYMTVLGQPIYVINSFKIANELLDKRAMIYSDRPIMTMAQEL